MAGQFCPADQTGGDTFDLVPLDEHRLFVLLGDASGHGIGPALSATQMTGMLRVALRLGADLNAIFAQVNNQLVEDLPEEHFVTAFFGVLDTRTHAVGYHAAGQGPLLHFLRGDRRMPLAVAHHFSDGFHELSADRCAAADRPRAGRHPRPDLGWRVRGRERRGRDVRHRGRRAGAARRPARVDVRPAGRVLQAVHVHADGHPQADDMTIVLLARRNETAGRTTVQQYFPRSFDALDGLFRFIGDFLAARSLDPELHGPVCFIVEELFTNFVKYNTDGKHDISLSLGHTPEQLTVRMTDFDVESFDPDAGAGGGRRQAAQRVAAGRARAASRAPDGRHAPVRVCGAAQHDHVHESSGSG